VCVARHHITHNESPPASLPTQAPIPPCNPLYTHLVCALTPPPTPSARATCRTTRRHTPVCVGSCARPDPQTPPQTPRLTRGGRCARPRAPYGCSEGGGWRRVNPVRPEATHRFRVPGGRTGDGMTQGLGPGACVRSCRRMSPKFQLPERCLRVLMHLPHPSHRHLVRLSALGLTHYIIYIYIYIYMMSCLCVCCTCGGLSHSHSTDALPPLTTHHGPHHTHALYAVGKSTKEKEREV